MSIQSHPFRPLIGITADRMIRNGSPTAFSALTYSQSVLMSGGVPILIPPAELPSDELIERLDGFLFSGGDDPVMEPFGEQTHEQSVRVAPQRQLLETDLLERLRDRPEIPVLGVCLGMQMLALVHGGTLNQHLPDTHTSAEGHWEHEHRVETLDHACLQSGVVYSKHRQAVESPGSLRTLAIAEDGVIEAVDAPGYKFCLGVQWHPERTECAGLGQQIIDRLVESARGAAV